MLMGVSLHTALSMLGGADDVLDLPAVQRKEHSQLCSSIVHSRSRLVVHSSMLDAAVPLAVPASNLGVPIIVQDSASILSCAVLGCLSRNLGTAHPAHLRVQHA